MSRSLVVGTSSGRRRNRSWPVALKREIVAASLAPGSSVSVVARQYDVNANQVFAWRKLYREVVQGSEPMQLLPVAVTPDAPPEQRSERGDDAIEIELGRYRLRVGSGVEPSVLRQVLDVLEQR